MALLYNQLFIHLSIFGLNRNEIKPGVKCGSFYFKQTSSSNLIGEFTNNESTEILAETATPSKLIKEYDGVFDSVWFDIELHRAELTISKIENKYKLKWIEPGKPSFEGEGMLVDNILIGYYKMT